MPTTISSITPDTVSSLVSSIPQFQGDPKSEVLDNPPKIWEVINSTTGTIDIDKAAIFYAKLKLDIPERVSVDDSFSPHCSDPQECWDFQNKTLEAVLEEIILDDTERTHVIEKAKEIEEAYHNNLRGKTTMKTTEHVAKRVQRTIDAYLASDNLQANPLAEQIAKRIIKDLEYLVKDPVNRWHDFEFTNTTCRKTKGSQTRRFILNSLRNKNEPEIINWLLKTYVSYPTSEEGEFGFACTDFALSNALSD